jgi:hypothetical protein
MPSRARRRAIADKVASDWGVDAPYPSGEVQTAYEIWRMREDKLFAQRQGRKTGRPIPPEPELPKPYLSWIHIRDFLDPIDVDD